MVKIKWPIVILISNLIVISLVILLFLNRSYPMVGHDYAYSIPQMLDTALHFRVNGLSIQWYTPSFGGGVPAFPDPNNSQFSLLEMLSLLIQPWQAVMVSVVIFIFVGGMASYYFLNRVLRLHWTSSILGTIFFTATGFYMYRMACGHVFYQTFLLFVVLFVAMMDSALPRIVAGFLFGLVITLMIHEAGFFLVVVFGFSMLVTFPVIYIYNPTFPWKRSFSVVLLGGLIALLMSASKLSAVYSFMILFPRQISDYYQTTNILTSIFGIASQLLGTMTFAPVLWVSKSDSAVLANYMNVITGAPYGYWEFDMSMSPAVYIIILLGIYSLLRKPKKLAQLFRPNKKWIAWLLLIFFTWLVIEFILAKGVMYPYLHHLPILSSLHVNPRFTAAFIFPIALCAAIFYNQWTKKWSNRKSTIMFLVVNVLTLLPLGTYFTIRDLGSRTYNIAESRTIYNAIQSGNTLNVTGIANHLTNTDALLDHTSNLTPYDPVFGYSLEDFFPEIVPGSIWNISGDYYNMTNPTGYVFPKINGTRPFERIHVSDRNKLDAFASHRQPDWKIPVYQQVLDWASGLTFVAAVIILSAFGFQRLRGKRVGKKGN